MRITMSDSEEMIFETPRELVSIKRIKDIPRTKDTHVFAACITSDGHPLIGARRTSFAFQAILSQQDSNSVFRVSTKLLRFMYYNEIREIIRRLRKGSINNIDPHFEELILLGGKLDKKESIKDCLKRELKEESDERITVKEFGNVILKLTTRDKLFNKVYIGYCMACFIDQSLSELVHNSIYNVEIRKIKSLNECMSDDKYEYLSYIYNNT
ncbi:mRNA decapping enzyme [Skunkpox virus]|uniref:mRNA decapping enzyme n=1 Tax=Skunkpox virus TaxID=160796 RepID=A0A1C9KBQ9_9POXV|nr:mRNA decapping enzyme [Skunkpox virus]AOP31592.1 mRNA decapping enzyme [Skunkpox virus]